VNKTGEVCGLHIRIISAADMTEAASYAGICDFAELDDLSEVRRVSLALLQKMGVRPTERTLEELGRAAPANHAAAQAVLSNGIEAVKKGAVVEALGFFIQASRAAPGLAEAAVRADAARTGVRDVGTGHRNAAAWRRAWTARLAECDRWAANYVKAAPPAFLVYSPDVKRGEIDSNKGTAPVSFDIRLTPDRNWTAPMTGVVDAVYAGLAETGQADAWKLNWPARNASGGVSFVTREVMVNYDVTVLLLDERGEILEMRIVPLSAGWRIGFNGGKASASRYQTSVTVTFPAVDMNKAAGKLTVEVVGVDEADAETAAKTKRVTVMTLNDYGPIVRDEVLANFVRVPGGTYMMTTADGGSGELSARQVTVPPFSVSRYEVTQDDYEDVVWKNPSAFKGGRMPVENVTWYDAVNFCNALSSLAGLMPAYTVDGTKVTWNQKAGGFRLPTEAEWVYAARGGAQSRGYLYAGSNNPDTVAWYNKNSGSRTHEAGSLAANELGLYDMSGNVYEWCWDEDRRSADGALAEPADASAGPSRVVRGGSWYDSWPNLNLTGLYYNTPPSRSNYTLGFRLALNAE
jgi:formylglycine-generating enzyme required for sulfatase activity